MYYQSLAVLWFTSVAAGAVFERRASANDSAPYSNVTLTSSQSSSIVLATDLQETSSLLSSSSSLSSSPIETLSLAVSSLGSSGQDADPSTESSLPGPPEPTTLSDAAASRQADVPIPVSQEIVNTTSVTQQAVNTTAIPAEVSASPTPVDEVPVNATVSVSVSALFPNATSVPFGNGTSIPTKTSNASCTVNIRGASIDYWYPATYTHYIGTLTTQGPNYTNADSYTLLPEATPFDVASALESDFACTSTTYWVEQWSYSAQDCAQYTVQPTAAATTVVSRTQYAPLPPGNVIDKWSAGYYDIYYDPGPTATIEVAVAPNVTQVQPSATPFVYFTAYEVESGNGTETVQLPSAHILPYTAKGLEDAASATGSLPDGFLEQLPQSGCDGGVLVGSVTVLVVVDLIYQNWPDWTPFIVHVESSASGFEEQVVTKQDQSSRGAPFSIGGWDLPKASLLPNQQSNPAPTTPSGAGNVAGPRETQIPNLPQEAQQTTIGSIGSNPVVIGPSSEVVIGSQTLRPGGPAITVDNTPISLPPSPTAIVVGGSNTVQLPDVNPTRDRVPPVITIGSSTFVPNAATEFFIAPGQTLTPGGVVTFDGTVISLAPSASAIIIGSNTVALPTAGPGQASNGPPQIVVGGATITAQPSQGSPGNSNNPGASFVVGDQTLLPGGPAITVSGTTLSLAPSASFVVVDGVTSSLVTPPPPFMTAPPLTIGNGVFRPLPGTGTSYLIGSSTLTPGGSVIVAGTTISLAPGATALVINGQTQYIFPQTAAPITEAPLLTIGSNTYTAISGTTFVIDGKTLTPGGVITVDGTTISLAPGATQLIYGSDGVSTTTALFPATTTRSQQVTSTASKPSAGASGSPGQAAPTTQGNDAGSKLAPVGVWFPAIAAFLVFLI